MRALITAAVILGGAFGSASATVESFDEESMLVNIEVEVIGAPDTVVVHLSLEEDRFTIPLVDRGDGVYGLRTELQPKNYVVVFEVVGADGETSEPTSLQEMGADLGHEVAGTTITTTGEEDGLSEESQRMLWLAIALGAASLSLLAFWVLGDRGDDEETEEDDTSTEEE